MSEQAQGHFIDIDGIPIHYVEAGQGRPLILVHGWSLDLTCWQAQLDHFAKQYHVIAYDWRGTGKSGGAEPPYELAQAVKELADFLAALQIERPILCGHSLGGDISLEYAVTYPDSPAALIIIDSPWFIWKSRLMFYGIKLGIFLGRLLRLKPPHKMMVPFCRVLFYTGQYAKAHPERIAAWKKQFLENSVPGLVNSGRAWGYRNYIGEKVKSLDVPTVIIRGATDRVVSQGEVEDQHSRIPGARLDVIEGTGHMSFEEVPGVVNETMETFLAGLDT